MTCMAEIASDPGACEDKAVAALENLGVLGRQLGASSWEITLQSDQVSTGRARIDDGMIRFAAPLVGPQWPPERMWEMLERNGLMGPGLRFGLSGAHRAVVIGETVLEGSSDVDLRVRRLIGGMTTLDCGENAEYTAAAVDPAALCEEAGWEFVRRREAIVVRLEANRHGIGLKPAAIPFSATVHAEKEGLRCAVELATDDLPLGTPNRSALAALLMQTGNQIRLVRPAARLVDGRSIVEFESRLLSSASAFELSQTLCALSVAVRLCGPEAAALYRDSDLAGEFLRIRFPSHVGLGIS